MLRLNECFNVTETSLEPPRPLHRLMAAKRNRIGNSMTCPGSDANASIGRMIQRKVATIL
jgi:hypothetical protein